MTVPVRLVPPRGAAGLPVAVALLGAAAAGVLVAVLGVLAVGALVALLLVGVVAVRPEVGAYVLLLLTPLIVGIDRGTLLPLLRPNEAVLLAVASGLVLRGVWRMAAGEPLRVRPGPLDVTLLAMAVFSSVTPLLWMVARGVEVTLDDVLYATTLWKYYGLYLVVRTAVRTPAQVARCLWLTLGAGVVVAVVAVLQSLQLFGVADVLARWYTPGDEEGMLFIGRGTSLIAHSISVGDVMVFDLAIVLAFAFLGERHRGVLAGLAVVFVFGALASGQFSAFIGLGVGALVVAVVLGRLRQVLAAGVPAVAVAAVALAPILQTRLAGFESSYGMPQSWVVRLENLREHFWPELFQGANWLLGVRTSARVPAPEVWRDFVFIESGHTWLLWNGGVPFLLAYLAFTVVALRRVLHVVHARRDAVAVAAVGAAAALWVVFVLMLFDPHLTTRGAADLLFPLVALALTTERGGGGRPRLGNEREVSATTSDRPSGEEPAA